MRLDGTRAPPDLDVPALRLMQRVAVVANETPVFADAMQTAIDEVCAHTGWPVGHAYIVSPDDPDRLDPTMIWHLPVGKRFDRFRTVTEATPLPRGEGLPGRILESGRPAWIRDAMADPNFPRAKAAADLGVHGAFGFPVLATRRVVAVLEFFSERIERPNEQMLEIVSYVGTQIGRVYERQAAKTSLLAQIEHNRMLIESSNEAFVGIDEEGLITRWNTAAEQLFGWPRSEAVGRHLAETIMPADQRAPFEQGLARFLETGTASVFNRRLETTAVHHDGHELEIELAIWPVRMNGAYEFCAFVRDVTEQKRAEDERSRLAVITETTDDAVFSKTIDGVILSWNRAAERLFGYTPDEAVGAQVSMLDPPGHEHEIQALRARVKRGESILDHDTLRMAKDGRVLDVSLTMTPIRDEHGDVTGASVIARDITHRKRAEERLRHALEREQDTVRRLRELDQAKTIFVSSVSHELRTPLTSIIGYTGLLKTEFGAGLSSTQRDMLDVIDRSSQRLLELIEDLLTFSRLEAGTYRPSLGIVGVSSLFEAVAETSSPNARSRDLELRFDDPGDVAFLGDGAQVERVLLNLISNAIKFTPEGGRVNVRASRQAGVVSISVQDTGMGVPEDDIPRLFQPFFRSSAADTLAVPGTGLGLAIVKAIVDGHGGTIKVTSVVDEGTTVTIGLPAVDIASRSTGAQAV